MRSSVALPLCLLVLLAAQPAAAAEVKVSVQGLLRSAGGGPVADGTYGVALRLYPTLDAAQPVFEQKLIGVQVSGGLFAVTLGGDSPAEALDSALFVTGQAAFVGVQVGAEPELPRQPLRAVPFAVHADGASVAFGLACSGCVDGSMLAAASVGSAQLQAGAVAAQHVAFTYAASQTKGGAADVALTANEAAIAAQAQKADVAAQAEELACTGCVTLQHLHPDVAGGFLSTSGGAVDGATAFSGQVALPGGTTITDAGAAGLKIAMLDVAAAPCGGANKGQIALGAADSALYFCNGSAWRKLAGCEGVCPLASTVECGLPVLDDCGELCGGKGTECPAGATCGVGGCAFPLGSQLNAAASCKAIKDAGDDDGDKVYWLDPDGDGGAEPFEAWCDMSTDGGGWTLVMRFANDAKLIFGSGYWTNTELFNDDAGGGLDPSLNENAKFSAFVGVPGAEVRGCKGVDAFCQKVSVGGSKTAQATFAGGQVTGSLDKGQLISAFGNDPGQPNCNLSGVNINPGSQYTGARLGLVGNNESDCSTADAAWGWGVYGKSNTSSGCGCGLAGWQVNNSCHQGTLWVR
jgi:hypothetical protein